MAIIQTNQCSSPIFLLLIIIFILITYTINENTYTKMSVEEDMGHSLEEGIMVLYN